jgi:glucose-1-phosphate cytidylyltransferase
MTKEKVVVLSGGLGTRLREETEFRPKPMVSVGTRPILWHIMKIYSHYGFNDFIICLGYKGNMIKEYFLNYEAMNNDFTIRLNNTKSIEFHNVHTERDWCITLAETGERAQTGARLKRIEKYVTGDLFMVTYGDGVANINVRALVEYHRSHGKIGTVTAVRPPSRFGEFTLDGDKVIRFKEKPQTKEGLINGGYFVFDRAFFSYLQDDDSCTLEEEPLRTLAADGELMIYSHREFWQCVDTSRELEQLNNLWNVCQAPWKVWK